MDNPQSGSLIDKTVEVKNVYTNVSQEIVKITVDKLRIVLTEHLKCLEEKKAWMTPLGIFITLMLVFTTADFKDSLTVKSSTWEAFFLMGAVLTFIWLLHSIIRAIKTKTIEDVIEILKKNND